MMNQNSSNDLKGSEPVIVSTSTSAEIISNELQKCNKCKIIIDHENAQKFMKEIKRIQSSKNKIKEVIKLDKLNEYGDAAKHIKMAIDILKNNESREKNDLEKLYKQFEKRSGDKKFYKFVEDIKCNVETDNNKLDGKIIAIDDGVVAVVETNEGVFMITIANQLEIFDSTTQTTDIAINKTELQKGGNKKKSIFSPQNTSSNNITKSSKKTSSQKSSNRSSNNDKSLILSADEISNDTESMSPSSNEIKSVSPYLNTSEYNTLLMNKNKSSDTNSSSNKSEYVMKSSSNNNNDKYTSTIYNEIDKLKGGDYQNNKPLKIETTKKTDTDKNNVKFMKAGRRDNIGIIESSKSNNNYYSESSSAVDGLCE